MVNIPDWKRGIYQADGYQIISTPSLPTIPATAIIPEPVQTIQEPKGYVVSKRSRSSQPAPEPEPQLAIPEKLTDIVTQAPVQTMWDTMGDMWALYFGTGAEKIDTALQYTPTRTEMREYVSEQLEEVEAAHVPISPITGDVINFPEIKIPDFGDIGKYALIGLVALGGLFLAGSYIGRKK